MENKFVYIVNGVRPIDNISWIETAGQHVEDILSTVDKIKGDDFDTEVYNVVKFDLTTGKQVEFNELEYNIFSDYSKRNGYPYSNSLMLVTLKRIKALFEEDFYDE